MRRKARSGAGGVVRMPKRNEVQGFTAGITRPTMGGAKLDGGSDIRGGVPHENVCV